MMRKAASYKNKNDENEEDLVFCLKAETLSICKNGETSENWKYWQSTKIIKKK